MAPKNTNINEKHEKIPKHFIPRWSHSVYCRINFFPTNNRVDMGTMTMEKNKATLRLTMTMEKNKVYAVRPAASNSK